MANLDRSDRLRIGVFTDSLVVPQWIVQAVELVRNNPRATLDVLLVSRDQKATATLPEFMPGLRRLYHAFDSWRFPIRSETLTPKRLDDMSGWRSLVEVAPEAQELQEALSHQDLDVILWLAATAQPEPFAQLAKEGIWRWRFLGGHLGNSKADLSPDDQSFFTVIADADVIEARLTSLGRDGVERVLVASRCNTVRFSSGRTEAGLTRRAARLLPRAIAEVLDRTGRERETLDTPPATASSGTGSGLVGKLTNLGVRYIGHHLQNARRMKQWALAFHRGLEGEPVPAIVPGLYADLIPPPDRDWADPFPVRYQDVEWVFFEELLYSRGVGHLSVAPLGTRHFTAKPEAIIVEDFHLSYPHVFQYDGQFYLLPETSEQRQVQLYRAVRFPFEWQRDRVLVEGTAVVDPSLAQIDGRWWMFTCDLDDGIEPWGELHLFHAPSPFGPWTPHRRNPVVADVGCARPAGRIFSREGVWYRPAQDCSQGYGHALALYRIEKLNEHEFKETMVARLDPTWDPRMCGVHTLNMCGSLTFIDVRRLVRRGG